MHRNKKGRGEKGLMWFECIGILKHKENSDDHETQPETSLMTRRSRTSTSTNFKVITNHGPACQTLGRAALDATAAIVGVIRRAAVAEKANRSALNHVLTAKGAA